MTNMQRVGLFFGSFNPIHQGHLIISNWLLQHHALEDIWFVLSPQNPFKTEQELLDSATRLKLLEWAIEDNPHFKACDIELQMEWPSYTYKTLDILRQKHPELAFSLIIGADNLAAFERWKNYQRILDTTPILVYPRLGVTHTPFDEHPAITRVSAPLFEISSTAIRQMIQAGQDPRYLLPEKVRRAILHEGLFSSQ